MDKFTTIFYSSGMYKDLEVILKKYRVEAVLIIIALITATVAFIFLVTPPPTPAAPVKVLDEKVEKEERAVDKIYVEASGAVLTPGVYELTSGSRLKHLVESAGGLSWSADKAFFARNFNLARILKDQEKIYIPSQEEVLAGITIAPPIEDKLININTANLELLDSLTGVGQVTAQKIIDNRPYSTVDDLVANKVISNSVFEKIKEEIGVE